MFYFNVNTSGKLVSITVDNERADGLNGLCRWNFKTFADAEDMAARANALKDGHTYIATDAGSHMSPRYDVQRMPEVGQEVSCSFNGDTYPCGKIVSVGKGAKMIVKTDTGATFYRRKLTGSWLKKGGTWWLVQGHINERNPHI